MIMYNNEFCFVFCSEIWFMEKADDGIARCNCKGDVEWMVKVVKKDVIVVVVFEEFIDVLGNVVEVKKKVDKNSKEAKKKVKFKAKRRARGEEVSDSEDGEWEGFGEGED